MSQFILSNIEGIMFGVFFAIIMLLWSIKDSLDEIKKSLNGANDRLDGIEGNTADKPISYKDY